MLVSVCVPTYNQESEIRDTLDGILSQSLTDYEIIIADDCSTDNTLSVCREYATKHPEKIRIIAQPQNKGIIQNTKDVLLAATGKYIAVCEGDDYWIDNDKLKKQVEYLEKHSDVSMSHTAWRDFYVDKNEYKDVYNSADGKPQTPELQSGLESFTAIIMHRYRGIRFSSTVFRRDIFEKIITNHPNFFSEDFTTIDIGIFYAMAYYGRLHFLEDTTTVYRLHDGSVSVNKDEHKQARFTLGVLTANAYFCREFGTKQNVIDTVFRRSLAGLAPYVLKYSDHDKIRKIKALAKSPNYKFTLGQILCLTGGSNRLFKPIATAIIQIRR